jgi:hypothetical protein
VRAEIVQDKDGSTGAHVLATELVTVYPVIAEPPVSAGAVSVIVRVPSPGVTLAIVGAPGTDACENTATA